MSNRSIAAFAVAVLFLGGLLGVRSVLGAAESPTRSREAILKVQLKLTEEALDRGRLSLSAPRHSISSSFSETVTVWSLRQMEIRSELGGKAERIAALETHKATMEELADSLEALFDAGRLGDRIPVLNAEFHALEAERLLLEARATD